MSSPTNPRRGLRRYLPWLGLLLLAWVLSRFDLDRLASALRRVTALALLEAFLLFGANVLLKALRWQRMLKAQALELPARVALSAYLASTLYGQVTLGRLGELYRAEALIERGVPGVLAVSSSIYDRILDLAVVLLVGAVLGALVLGNAVAAVCALGALLVLLSAALAILKAKRLATLAPIRKLRTLLDAQRSTPTAAGLRGALSLLAQLVAGLDPLLAPRFALESLLWTAIAWSGYFGSLLALASGLDIDASAPLLLAAAAWAALSSLLPITVSGLGAREVVFIQVLALEHIDGASAVVLSLLHLALMTATVVVLGLAGVFLRQRQRAAGTST